LPRPLRFFLAAAFMVALYAATLFASAALLFLVQPMFARLVLPLLGGSPAVWNTAMVFYQALLLAGYAYAHASIGRLGARRQAVWHLLVLVVPLALLPIAVPAGWTPPAQGNPAPWLLALMAIAVGAPFFAVSTTSPVLQKWFAASGHTRAADPYFLYAASNIGSLLALLSYPLWFEPRLRLVTQTTLWAWGYIALVVLIAACAGVLWKTSNRSFRLATTSAFPFPAPATSTTPLSAGRRLRWVLLSFAPSSLMLGVTTYLSSEIAVVPLLWIIPLALYLLTFVVAFASRPLLPPLLLRRTLPIVFVALVMVINMQATQPIGWLMLLHLVAFFVATLLCHGALAADRPAASHLTEFYLWMSVGGVLGGLFNALLAPLLFSSVAEYPVTLVLAAFLALAPSSASASASIFPRPRLADYVWPFALGLLTAALLLIVWRLGLRPAPATSVLIFGLPALLGFFFSRHPLRFALGLGAMLLAGSFYEGERGRVLHTERSFFGVHRVTEDTSGGYHLLVHGKTLHGRQSLDPTRRTEPLTYYHRSGPIGQILATYARDPHLAVGAVGLGAGSLASYASLHQPWTYYEIDPVVERLARDPRYFTFLRDSPGDLRVVLGDARLTLATAPDRAFGVLVLDAFSSDAIPVHLVTREAFALYRRKLAPHGLLACHISNLHLDLEPVFANLARDAGLVCLLRDDTLTSDAEAALGKSPSVWLVLARDAAEVSALAADNRWRPARPDTRAVWTDDYSSLLSAFRWQ
jgi:spermidine synthase